MPIKMSQEKLRENEAPVVTLHQRRKLANGTNEVGSNKKLKTLEHENQRLRLTLDEVTKRDNEKQHTIDMLQHKICDEESKLKIAEDELREMKKQFIHLEEAHRSLQDQFQASVCAWEREKCSMIRDISTLLESVNDGLANEERLTSHLDNEQQRKKMRYSFVGDGMASLRYLTEALKKKQDEMENTYNNVENERERTKLVGKRKRIDRSKCQLRSMEEAEVTERKLRDEIQCLKDRLKTLDNELMRKSNKENEMEFRLQRWKSLAEHLAVEVEENLAMRRELESSLLAQAEVEELLRNEIEENKKRTNEVDHECVIAGEINSEFEATSQIDEGNDEKLTSRTRV